MMWVWVGARMGVGVSVQWFWAFSDDLKSSAYVCRDYEKC